MVCSNSKPIPYKSFNDFLHSYDREVRALEVIYGVHLTGTPKIRSKTHQSIIKRGTLERFKISVKTMRVLLYYQYHTAADINAIWTRGEVLKHIKATISKVCENFAACPRLETLVRYLGYTPREFHKE